MDKVVSFSMGRLGNIMFCVASGKYYADKHGMDFYLLRNKSHDDYLSRYEKTFFKDIKMVDSYDDTFEVVKERKGYDPIVRKSTGNLYIDGYRESPKYWDEDKEYIYSLFKPEEGLIEAIKKTYDIDFSEYVSINVRRGDYLKEDVQKRLGLLKVDFFYNCIKRYPSTQKFLISSDDIEWCKSQFSGDKFLFADREIKGYEKIFVDLWIQTLCAGNIISNSTFSWWGAYLNQTPGRKVHYPYRFFRIIGDRHKIPTNDNWIEMPAIWDDKKYSEKDIKGKATMKVSEGITKRQEAIILNYARRTKANLKNPVTISDKLQWLKLYDCTPLKTKCADKLRLHEYSKEKLGEDICPNVLKIYGNVDEINFDELPDRFVLKCNHGSGMNIVVPNKKSANLQNIKDKLKGWLNTDFSEKFGEIHYHDIVRKCYAEEYMGDDLIDYKFWCFNGEPKFFTIGGGGGHGAINHYDFNGNYLGNLSRPDYPSDPSKKYSVPKNLDEMLTYAKILSKDFYFVRVDFYEVNGKTVLGELTFIPGAGNIRYTHKESEIAVGKMLKLQTHNLEKIGVVYTCVTGNYEAIQPLSVKSPNFDYVCYTDQNVTSNFWEIRPIPEKVKKYDNKRKNRYIKLHPHEFFPEYGLSVYIDGNVNIRGDLEKYLDMNCRENNISLFLGKHPTRNCIYEEAKVVVKTKKDTADNVDPQIERYKKEGFPKNFGLSQNCIMIRRHNDKKCIETMNMWWEEVLHGSYRDQLSLFYVLWKTGNKSYKILPKDIFKNTYFIWEALHKKEGAKRSASEQKPDEGVSAFLGYDLEMRSKSYGKPKAVVKPKMIKTEQKQGIGYNNITSTNPVIRRKLISKKLKAFVNN